MRGASLRGSQEHAAQAGVGLHSLFGKSHYSREKSLAGGSYCRLGKPHICTGDSYAGPYLAKTRRNMSSDMHNRCMHLYMHLRMALRNWICLRPWLVDPV